MKCYFLRTYYKDIIMHRNNNKWNRMLTFFALGLMFTTAHSGTPLWSFEPQTATTITLTKVSSAKVRYTVHNQSIKPKVLLMRPIVGVSQSTPCQLQAKGSCILTLNINGSALQGDVLSGPVLCQQDNELQCYQPSQANSLHITLVQEASKYSVGGNITGLSGTVTLQNNSVNPTPISTDGSFTFSTPIAQGSPYSVTVGTQPVNQNCTVTNGSGIIGGADVTNVTVACSTVNTTLSVSATATIPVNTGSGTLTVTNTGANIALNVHAELPSPWIAVIQDETACTAIPPVSAAPNNTCTLNFTSNTPYVAQGLITVTGDNIITPPPTTAIAFTTQGYLIWDVLDPSTVQVIDTADLATEQWGNNVITGAQSFTDGVTNTNIIQSTAGIGVSAAVSCYNSTNGGTMIGTWYLPAICQMGGAEQGAGCTTGLANIYTNLAQFGFGDFSPLLFFWSSTESNSTPVGFAWIEGFTTDFQSDVLSKSNTGFAVRCAQTLTL